MKSSSTKKKPNSKHNNYEFSTNYQFNSSCVNENCNLSSQSNTNKSSTSASSTGDIDLDAGGQENEPADESMFRFGTKPLSYKNSSCCQSESRPHTESTILSTSPSISDEFLAKNQTNRDDDDNSSSDNNDDDEEKETKADDGNRVDICYLAANDLIQISNLNKMLNSEKESFNIESDMDDTNFLVDKTGSTSNSNEVSYMEKFEKDYDGQVELIADHATSLISDGSFFNCGLYQFLSFLFISISWTIGNGWYAYVSVFYGYTPPFECDYNSMGSNLTAHPEDKECSALNAFTNKTVKCTKWTYDRSQLASTLITEYNLVCEKNYYFELAYSIEQIGYIIGTLIFSYLADKIGRKPVFVSVIISMSILGVIQYFVIDLYIYFLIGFIINSLACGLEAVCVTLVLEMFSTSKRTIFGIGIEVVWVIVLASMSPLAYLIQTWREIRLAIFLVLTALSLGSHWMVQESIRWLISIENLERANKIVQKIAKYNNLTNAKTSAFYLNKENLSVMFNELSSYNKIQTDKPKQMSTSDSPATKRTSSQVVDIVKHPKFRLYVIIMALNWFATALVYDGLTYLNNHIGENIFFNWIAMNMIELPAQFVCYLVISRYGRRLTTSVTLVLVGATLLLTCLDVIEVVAQQEWFKLLLFVLAKFVITQSYSAVILHAPELFPTNLRSFGYGISLFSGKVTACISPMISFYLVKIYPVLPSLIYGIISVVCGFLALYVPETLNRPLPNSIEDVLKWPRTLTEEEWKAVDELNKKEFDVRKVKNFIKTKMCCKKQKNAPKENINVIKENTNILKCSSSSLLVPARNEENCNLKLNESINQPNSAFLSSSALNKVNTEIKIDIELANVYSSSSSSNNSSSSSNSLSSMIA